MPVQKINITDDDIKYAESILLPNGGHFDDQRKEFIRNLDTIDLQAVPGSGKTTALLAKLLILERYMPFENGSGILIISHTNAAIDEIKERIGKYCPKLFSYPNFVGTIQSFVDEFLAKPCGQKILNARLSWIDTDRYKDVLWNKFQKIYWDDKYGKPGPWLWNRHIKQATSEGKRQNRDVKEVCNEMIEETVKNMFFDFTDETIKLLPNNDILLKDKNIEKYIGIKEIIKETLKQGTISYEYAYNLAKHYLNILPKVKILLQKRFHYVFVDEMQDMDTHQYELLEKIFYDKENSLSRYQRIGDKNQAIYSGDAKIADIWEDRKTVLPLNGSHRLSKKIAQVVQPFALHPIKIDGLGKHENSLDIDIKPHLIVYDKNKKEEILCTFAKIIKKLQANEQISTDLDNSYHAIAWNVSWKNDEDENDPDKIRLSDYCSFSKDDSKAKVDYSTLESYLNFYDKDKKTLESIRKSILNALLKIMRLEEIKDENGRDFSKRKLINYLSEPKNEKLYEKFKFKIYQWSIGIIREQKIEILKDIQGYIPEFLKIFNKPMATKSRNFINTPCPIQKPSKTTGNKDKQQNIFKHEDISIQIGSVHSVKGQTHTATLYLETYYYQDGKGKTAKSYESERLADQFKMNNTVSGGERVKQSAKMVYVGFSRPTHLLCFAVRKERFEEQLADIDIDIWEVVEIYHFNYYN